jgi:hypothetical protein
VLKGSTLRVLGCCADTDFATLNCSGIIKNVLENCGLLLRMSPTATAKLLEVLLKNILEKMLCEMSPSSPLLEIIIKNVL